MNYDPRPLLALQAIDLEQFGMLEQLAANAAAQEELAHREAAWQQKLRAVEQRTEECRAAVGRCEQSLKEHEEAKTKLLKHSATIKKNDEYQVAMAQIAALEQSISQDEEAVLAALDRQEQQQRERAAAQAAHARGKAQLEAQRQELQSARAELERQLKENQSRRAEAAGAVEPTLLRRYDAVRAGRNFSKRLPAVVPVEGGTCGRCNQSIPTRRREEARHGELTNCENCAAFLYSKAYLDEQAVHSQE